LEKHRTSHPSRFFFTSGLHTMCPTHMVEAHAGPVRPWCNHITFVPVLSPGKPGLHKCESNVAQAGTGGPRALQAWQWPLREELADHARHLGGAEDGSKKTEGAEMAPPLGYASPSRRLGCLQPLVRCASFEAQQRLVCVRRLFWLLMQFSVDKFYAAAPCLGVQASQGLTPLWLFHFGRQWR
jgi:hypothetical protein